jgi:hypothetical protein
VYAVRCETARNGCGRRMRIDTVSLNACWLSVCPPVSCINVSDDDMRRFSIGQIGEE